MSESLRAVMLLHHFNMSWSEFCASCSDNSFGVDIAG